MKASSIQQMAFAEISGGALLRSVLDDMGTDAGQAKTRSADQKERGFLAWFSAFRLARKQNRELSEVVAMAKRYERTQPSFSAELYAAIARTN